jgi:hypothetical protein
VTVDDALKLARDYGVRVTLEGDDLALEAETPPPPGVVAILGRGKWDIVAALRLREAEERRRIVQWVNDHFTPSLAGACVHCGDGPRPEDPFVLLFVGSDRGEVHSSCHPAWLAAREAEACKALGLEIRRRMANVTGFVSTQIPHEAGGLFSVNPKSEVSIQCE